MNFLILYLISQSLAAPALVTVFQTVTENSPSPTLEATQSSINVQQSAPTIAQTTATSTSTGSWLSNFLNEIQSSSSSSSGSSFWDSLFGSSSTSTSTPSTSTTSSSSSFFDLLKGLFGSNTATGSSPVSSPTSSIFTSSTSGFTPISISSSIPTTLVTSSTYQQPSTSSTTSQQTSSTSSTSSSDIYAAIDQISGIDKSFATDILNAHNQYRSQHQVGDLSWDIDTYNYAKNNADNYDCSGVLTHTHGQYGENLAAGFKTGPLAVQAWVDEPYDYSTANTYNHFTQVVWKASTKVGCAYKDCSSTGWGLYVVCEYDPAGNMIGEEKENVLPST